MMEAPNEKEEHRANLLAVTFRVRKLIFLTELYRLYFYCSLNLLNYSFYTKYTFIKFADSCLYNFVSFLYRISLTFVAIVLV